VAKTLSDALVAAGRADPGVFDLARERWDQLLPTSQRAICEAVSVVEGRARGGRLDVLATLPSTSDLARHAAQELLGNA
jgi:hypothetical protein